MRKNKILALFLLSGLLCACEHTYQYSYTVLNSTDTTLFIRIKTHFADSVYTFPKDLSKTLFITDHGIEGSKGPYFRDVNKDLDVFTATSGQIISGKNFLSNDSWSFEKGEYKTTLTRENF